MDRDLQGAEKRRTARVPVDMLLNKFIKGRPYICRASNISHKGLLVHRVHEPFSGECQVGLQFMLPGTDRIITCAGKILYEHGWVSANGIRFTSVSAEHQKWIDEFIESQLSFVPDIHLD
jgi:hypothetical protein